MKTEYHIKEILYCKKSLFTDNLTFYIKGKTYEIMSTSNNYIHIQSEQGFYIPFNLNEINSDDYKLYKYFHSKQYIRKLKLDKINSR